MASIVQNIQKLERVGVAIHAVALDIGADAPRRPGVAASKPQAAGTWAAGGGPALKARLSVRIRECISAVPMMDGIDEVHPRAAMSDLGVDSVMTVVLRQKLQASFGVKVPPTLICNHPTVAHLVEWLYTKLTEQK